MKGVIDNIKNSDTWKIQLTIESNFISPKDTDEEPVKHSEDDHIEIMIYDKADEAIKKKILNLFFMDIKLDGKNQ